MSTSVPTSDLAAALDTGPVASAWRAVILALVLTVGLFAALPLLGQLPSAPPPQLQIQPLEPAALPAHAPLPEPIAEPPQVPELNTPAPEPPAPQPSAPAQSVPPPPIQLNLALPPTTGQLDVVLVAPPVIQPVGPSDGIFDISGVDHIPRPIHRTPPLYPSRARLRHMEGTVELEFVVDASGQVINPVVVSATPAGVFEASALRAVQRWRFEPGKREGEAVPVRVRQTLEFKLESQR